MSMRGRITKHYLGSKTIMRKNAKVKQVIYICVLLTVLSVVFHTGRFLCINLQTHYPKTGGFILEKHQRASHKSARSPTEKIREMQLHGFLKKDASVWYAAQEGKNKNKGTADSPWDLATAFAGGSNRTEIKPGDLVWIRGGRYTGMFTAKIQGRSTAPVHFRGYPGESVVLDKTQASREKAALNVRGDFVWFWDFEVMNSFPNRQPLDSAGELNPWRGSGINVWAANTKYINLIVHDNGHGFGVWNEDGGTEIYGCLIFNNGNNKKEHGIYAHNKNGTQVISDNLIFNNAGYGLHIYANSEKSSIDGFDITGNVVFSNGSLIGEEQSVDQILVGGVAGVSADRINLCENYVYNSLIESKKKRGIRLGYRDTANKKLKLSENLIISRIPLKILWWETVEMRRNIILSPDEKVEIEIPQNVNARSYNIDANTYYFLSKNNSNFMLNSKRSSFLDWQRENNFDSSGIYKNSNMLNTQSPMIFIRNNKYEKSRANVIIFNLSNSPKVSLNLSKWLQNGDLFEIRDVQNYLGDPVLRGVYEGQDVILPLNDEKVMQPQGKTERDPKHTKADFAVFVIRKLTKIIDNKAS